MRRVVVLRLSLLFVVGSGYLLAQPAFLRKDIPVGPGAEAVVAGDFNGDKRPDLVVDAGVDAGDVILVMLNGGDGAFAPPVRIEATAGRLVVADFDGDGKDDLAVAGAVLLSLGDGTFRRSQEYLGRIHAAVDFNSDNRYDLLASLSQETVVIWLGNGDGTFQRGPSVTTEEPGWGYSATVADFNRDGRPDVMLQDFGDLLVFLGHGDGTFDPPVRPSDHAWTLSVADFNGDGIPDLATEDRILLGDGDGNFTCSVWYQTMRDGQPVIAPAFTGWPIAAADFDGDGNNDFVLALEDRDFILVYPGKGDGSFLSPVRQAVGWTNPSATTADLDGDGRTDLVTVNSLSNTVTLLLSRSGGGPSLRRALSAASGTAIVAPDSLATLVAPTPATFTLSAVPPWPTQLGGISLQVTDSTGATHLAPLLFVSPEQINFQVAAGIALGEAALAVVTGGAATEIGGMRVEAVAPALFMISQARSIPAATAITTGPDGSQVGMPVFLCDRVATGGECYLSGLPVSSAGDRPIYVSFFGTGFRGANTNNVTCTIDRVPVPVVYAGPQGTPGLDQINVRLVPELKYGRGYGEGVTIRINGVAANSSAIYVR
jgi:uncharacterized protein (TIGR03437 family)